MNRTRTDFLCASSSFLAGVGSVLDIGGGLEEYNCSDDPDAKAIANDWWMVGDEIREALEQAEDCPPTAQE
jgi:hypothetical protein